MLIKSISWAALIGLANAASAAEVVISRAEDVSKTVGQTVTLRGTVQNSLIADLLGVDVGSDSPDLRGHEAEATGRLEKQIVTQEEIDREIHEHGQFAHRGAGTYYRLIDSKTGDLARVRPARSTMMTVPSGRFQSERASPGMTLDFQSNGRMVLTTKRQDWTIEGPLVVTAMKMADYQAILTVDHRTGGSGPHATDFHVGDKLRFMFDFGCSDGFEEVQFSVHNASTDGRDAVLRTLHDWTRPCTESPPIDGSLINQQAKPIRE